MNRIVIEVSGGAVQNVVSDQPIELYLLDWDNIEGEPPDKLEPDTYPSGCPDVGRDTVDTALMNAAQELARIKAAKDDAERKEGE